MEYLIYAMLLLNGAIVVLVAGCCFVFISKAAGNAPQPEHNPAEKVDAKEEEKKKKEAEKRKQLKELADKEQAEMDEAVERFISRGGLPR